MDKKAKVSQMEIKLKELEQQVEAQKQILKFLLRVFPSSLIKNNHELEVAFYRVTGEVI